MILLDRVRKSYDDGVTFAVRDCSLRAHRGELLVLVGASGCGKTTTLKMINRLIEPTEGRIEVDGRDVRSIEPHRLRRAIGYVFQDIGLFPHLTIGENIGLVPSLLRWDRTDIDARTRELLELVDLPPGEYAHRSPAELSGGQQQRVGVARALAARPGVLLMDEPFGALDPLTRDELQQQFRGLQQRLELTVIMVTHDMTEALLLADRIAVMHDGRLVGLGPPGELLQRPGHPQVAALLAAPRRQTQVLETLLEGQENDR